MELQIASEVSLNAQSIMTGRGCIIGQSGSGKSFLMGLIAEQLLNVGLPFCIVDTEGEYISLKAASPKVIVVGGESGDLPLDVDLERLFSTSIANSIPLVLDVSDTVERTEVVYGALAALYRVEEKVRRPFLVLIEEADKFAPQVVRQKINIIEELSVRGRKRGVGLMIATQRPSNISKNVLSQCSYGFIGKLTIENDLNAISQLFSERKALEEIVDLDAGEFMPFGIGYRQRFKVEGRRVAHGGMTPQIGDRAQALDVDVRNIINQLKGKVQVTQRERQQRREPVEKAVRIDAIPFSFTEQQAREYADRVARKMFGIFGRQVERPDTIAKRYVAASLCTIRIPTGRAREFREHSVIIGSGPCLIDIGDKMTIKRLPMEPARLSPLQERTLSRVKAKSGISRETLIAEGLLKQKSASADLRRLAARGIITLKGGRVYSEDYGDFYLDGNLEPVEQRVPEGEVEGEAMQRDKAATLLKNLYPTCTLLGLSQLFIPVYEITLRDKDKVRVFRIDGLYGKEIAHV